MLNRALFIFVFTGTYFFAQGQDRTGNVLIDAMHDEMQRSMNELSLPPFEKPFFMMFGLRDQKIHSVSASLGSLTNSTDARNRFRSNSRVLVGTYDFNDESLEDDLFSNGTMMDIQLPLDDDYMGIRRSFWSITDNVYRNAARHYQKHKETLATSGKSLEEIPHRSFVKVEPTVMMLDHASFNWDKSYWEKCVKDLSSLFVGHTKIENSAVIVNFVQGNDYAVNSEGTKIQLPFSVLKLSAFAQWKNANGEMGFDQFTKLYRSPDALKDVGVVSAEISDMIRNCESQASIAELEEEYIGPVLITGSAVADVVYNALLRGPENIMANDQIQKLAGFMYNSAGQFANKIGKPVMHESISVNAKPKLQQFQGVDLLGSYPVDGEGVVPPDEVSVIARGILTSLLDNRTVTGQTARSQGFSNGPGVIELVSSMRDTEKELKEKLLASARAAGLEYAIIIRRRSLMGSAFLRVDKIFVEDGREEPVRSVYVDGFQMRSLRKVIGASHNYQAHNIGDDFGNGDPTGIVSMIVPDQLLVDELEIKPMRLPSFQQEEYVGNPLAGN